MKFQYTHLQQRSIRLIRFSQHCTPNFVHVWLEHLPDFQSTTSRYAALSYGLSETGPAEQKSITLNGRSFLVPASVCEALGAIKQHHDAGVGYWIDKVSINYGDPLEKTAQLALMPTIFSSADEVLLWLGPEDEQTEVAFTVMRERAASCPYKTLGECNASSEHRVNPTELEQDAMRSLLARDYFQKVGDRPAVPQMRNGHLLCGRFKCEVAVLVHYQHTSITTSFTEVRGHDSML